MQEIPLSLSAHGSLLLLILPRILKKVALLAINLKVPKMLVGGVFPLRCPIIKKVSTMVLCDLGRHFLGQAVVILLVGHPPVPIVDQDAPPASPW